MFALILYSLPFPLIDSVQTWRSYLKIASSHNLYIRE